VTLRKDGGVALTRIRMGLGWDPVVTAKRGFFGGGKSGDIDLDASVVLFADRNVADVVYYGQLRSKDGSIQHRGDNLTGAGEGDDEVVNVDLTRIPPQVTTLVFIVTSYRGQTFEQVQNAFCRLVDDTQNAELARFTLQGGMPFTGLVMAKVYRQGSEWKLQAIGEGINAKHAGEAIKVLGPYV
jgi:stress response protein SCP2